MDYRTTEVEALRIQLHAMHDAMRAQEMDLRHEYESTLENLRLTNHQLDARVQELEGSRETDAEVLRLRMCLIEKDAANAQMRRSLCRSMDALEKRFQESECDVEAERAQLCAELERERTRSQALERELSRIQRTVTSVCWKHASTQTEDNVAVFVDGRGNAKDVRACKAQLVQLIKTYRQMKRDYVKSSAQEKALRPQPCAARNANETHHSSPRSSTYSRGYSSTQRRSTLPYTHELLSDDSEWSGSQTSSCDGSTRSSHANAYRSASSTTTYAPPNAQVEKYREHLLQAYRDISSQRNLSRKKNEEEDILNERKRGPRGRADQFIVPWRR